MVCGIGVVEYYGNDATVSSRYLSHAIGGRSHDKYAVDSVLVRKRTWRSRVGVGQHYLSDDLFLALQLESPPHRPKEGDFGRRGVGGDGWRTPHNRRGLCPRRREPVTSPSSKSVSSLFSGGISRLSIRYGASIEHDQPERLDTPIGTESRVCARALGGCVGKFCAHGRRGCRSSDRDACSHFPWVLVFGKAVEKRAFAITGMRVALMESGRPAVNFPGRTVPRLSSESHRGRAHVLHTTRSSRTRALPRTLFLLHLPSLAPHFRFQQRLCTIEHLE